MKTNILTLIITLVVGIILAGSLLGPVISEAQNTIGPEVTITNNSAIVLREVEEGDVLKCVRTKTGDSTFSDAWTLNDEPITNLSGTSLSWNVGIISDAIYMQINSNSNSAAGIYYDMTATTPAAVYYGMGTSAVVGDSATTTFTFSNGTATAVNQLNQTMTVPYTWGYVVCPYEDGKYCAAVSGGVGSVSNADEVILGGAYTSGELDTMYYYKDGEAHVSNSSYTMTANITTAIHTGTTDIYDATVSVDMTDGTDTETFTPYRILVPYEVTGHEAGGASYTLLGAIPILVIVAILMVAVGAIVLRRND